MALAISDVFRPGANACLSPEHGNFQQNESHECRRSVPSGSGSDWNLTFMWYGRLGRWTVTIETSIPFRPQVEYIPSRIENCLNHSYGDKRVFESLKLEISSHQTFIDFRRSSDIRSIQPCILYSVLHGRVIHSQTDDIRMLPSSLWNPLSNLLKHPVKNDLKTSRWVS